MPPSFPGVEYRVSPVFTFVGTGSVVTQAAVTVPIIMAIDPTRTLYCVFS